MDLFIRISLFHIVLSVSCSLVVTCSKRADLLALLYLTFCCDCGTFPYGVLGRVWNLIVSIPELCLLPYFAGMQNLYKKEWKLLALQITQSRHTISVADINI